MGKTHWSIRALSLTLAICLLLGTVPAGTFTLPVFAAESSTVVSNTSDNVTAISNYAKLLLTEGFTQLNAMGESTKDNKVAFPWEGEGGKDQVWLYYNGLMIDAFLDVGTTTEAGKTAEDFAVQFYNAYIDDNGTILPRVSEKDGYKTAELDSVETGRAVFDVLSASGAESDSYKSAIQTIYKRLTDTNEYAVYANCGGNYYHKASSNASWTNKLCLDGLYMAQPFLMECGNAVANNKLTLKDNNGNAVTDADAIYAAVYKRLVWVCKNFYSTADKEGVGLYAHGYYTDKQTTNDLFWSRGVGWFAATLVDVIEMMPSSVTVDGVEVDCASELKAYLQVLFDGMLHYQDPSTGLWYNVVDAKAEVSGNALETSGTALMSYALLKAYNNGWVGSEYGEAGLDAFNGIVKNKLSYNSEKGRNEITGIYKTAGVEATQAAYCTNAYLADEGKGVGGVLMAAALANDAAERYVADGKYTVELNDTAIVMPTSGVGSVQAVAAAVEDASGNAVSASVTWTSTDPSVAMVDQNGVITAKSAGVAVIKATITYTGASGIALLAANTATYTDTAAVVVEVVSTEKVTETGAITETANGTAFKLVTDSISDGKEYFIVYKASSSAETGIAMGYFSKEREEVAPTNTIVSVEGEFITFGEGVDADTYMWAFTEYTGEDLSDPSDCYIVSNDSDTPTMYIYGKSSATILRTYGLPVRVSERDLTLGAFDLAVCTAYASESSDATWRYIYYNSGSSIFSRTSSSKKDIYLYEKVDEVTNREDVTISVAPGIVSLAPGGTQKLNVTVMKEGQSVTLSSDDATWTNGDSNVASVSNDTVTANSAGDTTVTLTVNSINGTALDEAITIEIPVVVVETTYTLTLNPTADSTVNMVLGETLDLSATLVASDNNYSNLTYQWFQIENGAWSNLGNYAGSYTGTSVAAQFAPTEVGTYEIRCQISQSWSTYLTHGSITVVVTEPVSEENPWVDASGGFMIAGTGSTVSKISEAFEITETIKTWTFTSVTNKDASNGWNAPVVLIQSDDTAAWDETVADLSIRADNFAWTGNNIANVHEAYTSAFPKGFDWSEWNAQNQNSAACTVTAQLVNGRIVAGITVNGVTSIYILKDPTSDGEKPYLYFSGDYCKLYGPTESESSETSLAVDGFSTAYNAAANATIQSIELGVTEITLNEADVDASGNVDLEALKAALRAANNGSETVDVTVYYSDGTTGTGSVEADAGIAMQITKRENGEDQLVVAYVEEGMGQALNSIKVNIEDGVRSWTEVPTTSYQKVTELNTANVGGYIIARDGYTLSPVTYPNDDGDPKTIQVRWNGSADSNSWTYTESFGGAPYHWYAEDAGDDEVYLYTWHNGGKLYLQKGTSIGYTSDRNEAAKWTITDVSSDNMTARLKNDNDRYVGQGSGPATYKDEGSDLDMTLYSRTTGYALLIGGASFECEAGIMLETVEAWIREDYSVRISDNADGTGAQVLDWTDASVDFVWLDSQGNTVTGSDIPGAGSYTVQVTVNGVVLDGSISVTAVDAYVVEITAPAEGAVLNALESAEAQATVRHTDSGVDTSALKPVWSSGNGAVLTIDSETGVITPTGEGEAEIIASVYENGVLLASNSITVTVVKPVVDLGADRVLVIGEDDKALSPVVTFGGETVDASGYEITYSVAGSAVTVGDNGALTTVESGSAVVTATISKWNGSETTVVCSDSVIVEVIYITKAELNKNSFTLYEGETLDEQTLKDLVLTVHWSDGPSETVTCNSAGVDIGDVNLSSPGTYIVPITYKKYDESVTVNVQVEVKEMPDGEYWVPIQHEAYERVNDIAPGIDYVIGRNASNTDYIMGHETNDWHYFKAIDAEWIPVYGTTTMFFNTGTAVQFWRFESTTFEYSEVEQQAYYIYYVDSNGVPQYLSRWGTGFGITESADSAIKWRATKLDDMTFQFANWSAIVDKENAAEGTNINYIGLGWRGGQSGFATSSGGGDYFYLYVKTTATAYADLEGTKRFDYINGEVTTQDVLAQVQDAYNVFLADYVDENGVATNETHLPWSSERIGYVWRGSDGEDVTFNPEEVMEYKLYVTVDGQIINEEHPIDVQIHSGIDHWTLNPVEITVPLNGEVNLDQFVLTAYDVNKHPLVTRKGEQIEFNFADATNFDGELTPVDTSVPNAVYTVPVLYNGEPVCGENKQPLTIKIAVSPDPYHGRVDATAGDYSGYPAEGSVKFDKNVSTAGTYYNQTGVAQLELTAAGVTASGAVDVVLIVDISNSMAWTDNWFDMSIYNGDYPASFDTYWEKYQTVYTDAPKIEDAWKDWAGGVILYDAQNKKLADAVLDNDKISRDGAAAKDKLDAAMESATAFADILLSGNTGNTLSFVTFAGMDHQHNTARDTIDSVHSVFTGVSDPAKAKVSFAGTQFYKLTPDGTSVAYELTLMDADGHILASGKNRGNTNYDYAFGQAYETVTALKAQIAAQYKVSSYEETGRQLHVVFMTDGAPSHYNGIKYDASPADYLWGLGVTGEVADQYPYFQVKDTNNDGKLDNATDSSTDGDWLKRVETYNTLATKLVEEGGLDGFHAVGFDMAHGGFSDHSWEKEELLGVIRGLVRNQVVDVMDATSGEELIQYYKDLASALTYSGTDAQVTDTIGSNFTLYTGTENAETEYSGTVKQPPSDMWIKSYRLVTMADVGKTLYAENEDGQVERVALTSDNITQHLGKRVMKLDGQTYVYDCIDVEHVVFEYSETTVDGKTTRKTTSYTTYDLVNGTSEKKDFNGSKIEGYYFTYTKDSEGVETIEWKIGDITDREIALSYYVYLKGSMDGSMNRPGGSYNTNEVATLEYVDNQGRHAARDYKIPNLPWQEASVTVRFYLVNEKGEYVNFAGTAFESESLRVFLAESYVYSGLELSGVNNFTSEQAYADAKVTKYPLYDKAVTLTVYRNPSSEGNAFGSGYTIVAGNSDGKRASQDLIKFVDTYGDRSYVKTVIEIPVVLTEDLGESLQRLEPAMVVVDYGKPIDIDVISDQEATYFETGFRAQDIKDEEYYWYQMEIIGFATYSELHDQKDYVREDSISKTLTTEYGQYTLVEDGHAGFQVRFTPSRFFEEPENVFVGIKFAKYQCVDKGNDVYEKGDATNDYFCMYKQLSVVPATVMYYETDFADNAFILHQGGQIQGMNFKAQLGFASDGWGYNDWNNTNATAQIKGPGTYTITLTPSQAVTGIEVLYVDIEGAAEALADYTISNVSMSVTVNGNAQTVNVDPAKLWVNTYGAAKRLCLYNGAWTEPKSDTNIFYNPEAIDDLSETAFTSLTVTFTLSESQAGEAAQAEGDTTEQSSDWTEKTDSEVKLDGVDVNENPGNAANSDWDHIQNDGPVGSGKGDQGDFSPVYAYGYDSTYGEDNLLSDGDSWFVKGASTAEEIRNNDPSTYATFTFTGTGFDLISRTGAQQATLRIHVTNKATGVQKIISVINKGANELYQIPVISVKDLEHGTYDVQIIVYESFTAEGLPAELKEQMARGNEFYFDAIRIYDPVAPETVITQDKNGADITVDKVYSEDGENEPQIIQIGKLLMDLKTYESLGGAAGNGAVYMDGLTLTDDNWKDTDLVQDYQSVGPNNEVYLKKDQGIAFILNIGETIPASIQIGAKSIQGTAPTLNVEIRSAGPSNVTPTAQLTEIIKTSTAMYYKVAYGDGLKTLFGNNQQVYVIIWNTSDAILSVTDIKIAYAEEEPDVPASVSADRTLVENAGSAMLKEGYQLKKIDDAWYYCDGEGNIQSDYTGLVETLVAGTWYVADGKVDFNYTGLYEPKDGNKVYFIRGGCVDSGLNGIASRGGKWMYFVNGTVDKTFTGIVTYGSSGQWYVENGVVQMDFSGAVPIGNTTYTITNGKVTASNTNS